MIGKIILFVLGAIAGGGAMVYHRRCVERETSQLRRENEHLKTSAWRDRIEYETNRAYARGYKAGRRNPMSDVERLADTLERRNIDFRPPKEVDERGKR